MEYFFPKISAFRADTCRLFLQSVKNKGIDGQKKRKAEAFLFNSAQITQRS